SDLSSLGQGRPGARCQWHDQPRRVIPVSRNPNLACGPMIPAELAGQDAELTSGHARGCGCGECTVFERDARTGPRGGTSAHRSGFAKECLKQSQAGGIVKNAGWRHASRRARPRESDSLSISTIFAEKNSTSTLHTRCGAD